MLIIHIMHIRVDSGLFWVSFFGFRASWLAEWVGFCFLFSVSSLYSSFGLVFLHTVLALVGLYRVI